MAPTFRYVVCDVFTDRPLTGNQLAVFTDARQIPEELLQSFAREMAFSETVFCYPPTEGGHVRIRIFTPANELPFAGHPVLGAAFVLAGPLQLVEIRLETGAGIIPVLLEREGARIRFGWMSQPVPTVQPCPDAASLASTLGIDSSSLPLELYDNGTKNVFFVLQSEEAVARLEPDMGALLRLTREGPLAFVHASCVAGSGERWKTRMFAPAEGVPEDPATGSAAGPLACHLARHGLIEFGQEIEIEQGAELDRPSRLHACVQGSPERIDEVRVGGSAVIVARGEFRLPSIEPSSSGATPNHHPLSA